MKALLILYVLAGDSVGVTKPFAFITVDACMGAGPPMAAMLPTQPHHDGPWQWVCVPVENKAGEAT